MSELATGAGADWTVKAADTIDGVVGLVRDKAVVPVTTATRWVVYGLLASIVGTMSAILLAAGAVRALDSYLPFDPAARRVWAADAIVGGIFLVVGLFLWARRKPRRRP